MMRTIKLIPLLLLGLVVLAMPSASQAQIAVGVSIRVGPPALPVYVQPECPAPGYHWIPGYWAYGPDGYYWVPGTWVEPPSVGVLWTPGYWGWRDGFYAWHGGYWGPHVGFYGGINYGFGYGGVGFVGGAWHGGVYSYNRSVTNVNVTVVHNTYNQTVINNNTTINRVSFNGGSGGVSAHASASELQAEHEHHFEATPAQTQHQHLASTNHDQLASINHGHPNVVASPKAGVFSGHGVVSANDHTNNDHTNFQKFSKNNSSPSGGSGAQGGVKVKTSDTFTQHGNNAHASVNGNVKTYHTEPAVHQNNAPQNNVSHNNTHTNTAHVNGNAQVHVQNGGQHGNTHDSHDSHGNKHDK